MDNRKINHGVWVDGKLITDLDELAKAKLSAADIKRLTDAGSIEGFSSAKAETSEADASKSKAKTKKE